MTCAWNAGPYQRYGAPVKYNEARFRVCKIMNLRVEDADLGLVGGPTMTFWPAPAAPPRELAAAIAGAVGAGLAPLIQPLQPGVAPGAALPAAPAPPPPGVGGVGDNAALPKAGAPGPAGRAGPRPVGAPPVPITAPAAASGAGATG